MILVEGDTRTLVFYLRRGGRAIDLTDASSVTLKFLKPSSATYSVVATVEDADGGKISAAVDPAEIDEPDAWWRLETVIDWGVAGLEHGRDRFDVYVRSEFGEGP